MGIGIRIPNIAIVSRNFPPMQLLCKVVTCGVFPRIENFEPKN